MTTRSPTDPFWTVVLIHRSPLFSVETALNLLVLPALVGTAVWRMGTRTETEFGSVEWSDYMCAYKVSSSMEKRQGCEEKRAAVG